MPFRSRRTVRFADVDPAGFVYYPRLLDYLHVAMEEFFAAELGIAYADFVQGERRGFTTVRLETEFRRPLRHGDEVEIEATIESVGRTSVGWRFRVFRGGESEPSVESRHVTVNLDLDGQEKRELPADLRGRLERLRTG